MDISKDIFEDIPDLETLTRRVETDRFGPFTFRLGLDLPALCAVLRSLDTATAANPSAPHADLGAAAASRAGAKAV